MSFKPQIQPHCFCQPDDIVADHPVVPRPGADRTCLLMLRFFLHPEISRVLVATVFENEALNVDIPQAAQVRRKDSAAGGDLDLPVRRRLAVGRMDEEPLFVAVVSPAVSLLR